MEPQIQYAKTEDGVSIAYATAGEGPPLILVPVPGAAHAQRIWEMFANIYTPLAGDFRLISYDPRGSGLSDRDAIDFSMEAMLHDLDAVVGHTGLQSFDLLSFLGSVSIVATYAATFPDRVSHLILVDGWASWSDAASGPAWEAIEALIDKDWTMFTETFARALLGMDDPQVIKGLGEHFRASIEPEAYRAFLAAQQSWDVAELLQKVTAQTLVLHNSSDRLASIRGVQMLAAGIPGARFLAIDDINYERVGVLVEDFAGAAGTPAEPLSAGDVHTILFTDMESSTALRRKLGDAQVQELVRAHNQIVRTALGEHVGREIKHTGDGIMASFSTATSALECSIAIQRGVAAHLDEHSDSPLGVYIGLNAGEPIAEEQDLFGTSVDLARRICEHAQPGQILASNVVRELSEGKGFLFGDIGEVVPKGFEEPVRLYEVRWRT